MFNDDSFGYSSATLNSNFPYFRKPDQINPSVDDSNSHSKFSQEPEKLVKKGKSLQKVIKNLDKLGFVSSLTNRPMLVESFNPDKKKTYTIGLADFWTFQDKLKYLKSRGYWAAYKKLIYNKHVLQYTSKKSSRNPDLPHVMDHHTVRLVKSMNRNREKRTKSIRTKLTRISPESKTSTPVVRKFEYIEEECEKVMSETYKFYSKYSKNQKDLIQDTHHFKSITPTRLVKRDKEKIQRIIKNLS